MKVIFYWDLLKWDLLKRQLTIIHLLPSIFVLDHFYLSYTGYYRSNIATSIIFIGFGWVVLINHLLFYVLSLDTFIDNHFLIHFFYRIFVNRSLHMENIKFFGFDMDYTLAGLFHPPHTIPIKIVILLKNETKIFFWFVPLQNINHLNWKRSVSIW